MGECRYLVKIQLKDYEKEQSSILLDQLLLTTQKQ
ncbi:unnamed protein product (macronuclear) [Paramecium tetraurelia]|uniref:Uncharacterized protein n=1 Tax=Paramecium tetraurelia TaxID=5888 RepID=A0BDX2_PARTE|nr:uncharacterized protein GSPATT00027769001 [Paramecium tetraurelia]CAK56739.1 unnamed protein product [Paramecium tetraurelia]